MALIKCPECGKEISDQASACIHCGFPLSKLEQIKQKEEGIILKRSKSSIFNVIAIFLITTIIFSILIGVFAIQIAVNDNPSLVFAFSIGTMLLTSLTIVSIGGLVISIVERAKNNNRININLIEYDKDNNLLMCRSYKDECVSIKPEAVRYLDGSSKVYLYYFAEDKKKQKKTLALGFANKKDIKEARVMIEKLKSCNNE